MFKKATPIIIKAISPIHAGSGRELGIVDMPIQRESHTGIPKIEGSSVKGSMREWTRLKEKKEKKSENTVNILFGEEKGGDRAGLLGFSDAKLLFYPIKTLQGVFAYISCPYLLNRFVKDCEYADRHKQIRTLRELIDEANNLLQGKVIISRNIGSEKNIVLDEYTFEIASAKNMVFKGIHLHPGRKVAILCDEDFIEMISLCKEVITRNRISAETGTVAAEDGALFTEEYLPAESILYTLLLENGIDIDTDDEKAVKNYVETFNNPVIAQIGGNVNIGKGIVEMKIYNTESSSRGEEAGCKA